MSELHLIQNDKILAKMNLPITWKFMMNQHNSTISGQLLQQFKLDISYTTHDGNKWYINSDQTLLVAYQDWRQYQQPTTPMRVELIEPKSFGYVPGTSNDLLQSTGTPQQAFFGGSGTFQITKSENDIDGGESAQKQCSVYSQLTQEPSVELFPLFFDKQEKIQCKCVKEPQVIGKCVHCRGSQVIDITPTIRVEIERMLQLKIQAKFRALQKVYKENWDIELVDMAQFVKLHQQFMLEGKFKTRKVQKAATAMTPQPPKSQQFYETQPTSNKPPNANKSPSKDTRQSNISVVSSHSGKSAISNTSQILKYTSGIPVSPNDKNFPSQTPSRKSGQRPHTIKIPAQTSSGRASNEMLSSQRSAQNQQQLNVSQSPLNQSSIGSNSSMINSKMSQYSAKFKEICIDMATVEPMSPVYFKVKLLNNGAYQLKYLGDSYRWPDSVMIKRIDNESVEKSIRPLFPLEEQVFQVQFFSPQQDGNYQAEWRLCYIDEQNQKEHFGPRFQVKYSVKTQNLEKKKNHCIEKLSEMFQGSKFEIESYVVKKLSEKPNLDLMQLVEQVIADIDANPNLFKCSQGIVAVKPQVK